MDPYSIVRRPLLPADCKAQIAGGESIPRPRFEIGWRFRSGLTQTPAWSVCSAHPDEVGLLHEMVTQLNKDGQTKIIVTAFAVDGTLYRWVYQHIRPVLDFLYSLDARISNLEGNTIRLSPSGPVLNLVWDPQSKEKKSVENE